MNNREKGYKGEDRAASYIQEQGAVIVDRNFYFKGGEIDIIARDNFMKENYLCFIEVKYRAGKSAGYPEEAITYSKQKNIIKGAQSYMNYKKIPYNTPCRFDVISLSDNEVNWIKNAFTM